MAKIRISLVTQALLVVTLLAAGLALACLPAAAQEGFPGVLEYQAAMSGSGTSIQISATLNANDGSGQTAHWDLSYDLEDDPHELTMQVTAPQTGGGTQYGTTLNAAAVKDLIAWLASVKAQMQASGLR